jgi:hypothetical protein
MGSDVFLDLRFGSKKLIAFNKIENYYHYCYLGLTSIITTGLKDK